MFKIIENVANVERSNMIYVTLHVDTLYQPCHRLSMMKINSKTNLGMPFMINLPAGEYLCDRVKLTFQWKDKNETKGGLK